MTEPEWTECRVLITDGISGRRSCIRFELARSMITAISYLTTLFWKERFLSVVRKISNSNWALLRSSPFLRPAQPIFGTDVTK